MSPPSVSELNARLPAGSAARFADDLSRLVTAALDGAEPTDIALLALAVSGGPDSMAMLALAVAACPGRVAAATFDHRLRATSATEARMVAEACRSLGVPHATLAAEQPINGGSLQRQAREARYAALTAWTAREGAGALLTAHHADDQAETLLMRLNRASGLAGLSAIRPWRVAGGIMLLRPLLGWRRAELAAVVAAAGLPFVRDPANIDPRHDRTRIRAALAASPDLDPARLARSAAFLAEAEMVIGHQAEMIWNERWHGADRAFAIADQPRELRRRLLRRALDAARRHWVIVLPPFAESANVEPLLDALGSGGRAVQAGVAVTAGRDGWRFRPAPPRRGS